MFNRNNTITIPDEYLRLECDILDGENYEMSDNTLETMEMEEQELDLREVVETLYGIDGTLHVRNQMAYIGTVFLKYGKMN